MDISAIIKNLVAEYCDPAGDFHKNNPQAPHSPYARVSSSDQRKRIL